MRVTILRSVSKYLLGVIDELYLANTAEHKGLALVISVGSNSQVHLLRVGVPLEGFGHSQDGIRRAHLNSTPPRAAKTTTMVAKISEYCTCMLCIYTI